VDIQTGRVLAEAKRVSLVQGQGFEIEERHYGSGDELIFQCTSRISFGTGWKVRETDAKGKKDAEYYFLFPRWIERVACPGRIPTDDAGFYPVPESLRPLEMPG